MPRHFTIAGSENAELNVTCFLLAGHGKDTLFIVADADNADNYRLVGFFDVVPEELPTYRLFLFTSQIRMFSEYRTLPLEIDGVAGS